MGDDLSEMSVTDGPGTDAVLPEGVVTFVFTDVEGSTELWDRHEADMRAALAAHDDAMAAAVARHGGVLLKHKGEGDSTVSVFVQPAAAVAAALDQQRLLAEAGAGRLALRARASVHTGYADRRLGDYQGPTLNRAARIRGLGAGGQVLLSENTSAAVAGLLPEGASVRDLGVHRLKGLAVPERVAQLIHPDLPDEFPPLASLDTRTTNLPLLLTALVGRRDELDRIRALAGRSRLVTLTGAGGSGKTRLALEAAGEATDTHPGGVWLVELGPVATDAAVASAVVGALGVQPTTSQSELDAAVTWASTRGRTLLVIDNCEHVLHGAAAAVATLVSRCPELGVLTTSRERLGVPGEAVFPVPPLGLPSPGSDPADSEAVQLFCQSAGRPELLDDPGQAATVAALCERLDGIPLALELAAARVRVLTPAQILERLSDRFRLLGGNRAAIPRQQTLRALVDWSHDLLDPVQQATMRRLAVFRGGFDIDAAEAVAAGDPVDELDVLDAVADLVDKSLLVVEDGAVTRYRMLETIREYGLDRLAAHDEHHAWSARHLAHYLAVFRRAYLAACDGGDQVAAIAKLDAEYDNIRAALTFAAEHDPAAACELVDMLRVYWEQRGLAVEAARWVRLVLPCTDLVEPRLRAAALVCIADTLVYHGDPVGAELLERAIALAEAHDDPLTLSRGLATRAGQARRTTGDDSAAADYERAHAAAREAVARDLPTARQQLRIAKLQLSWVGDLERAGRLLDELLEESREAGDLGVEAWTLETIAWRVGGRPGLDLETAIRRAIEIARRLGMLTLTYEAESFLGALVLERGDVEQAVTLQRRGAAGTRALGHPLAFIRDGELAWTLLANDLEAARRHIAEMAERYAGSEDPRAPADVANLQAELAHRNGDPATACALLRTVLAPLDPDPGTIGYVALRRAVMALRAGRPEEAARLLAAGELCGEPISNPDAVDAEALQELATLDPALRAAATAAITDLGPAGALAILRGEAD